MSRAGPLSLSRNRALWWLVAGLFFAAVYLGRIREDMVDFQVNVRAAERLLDGETLYQPSDGHFMFKYFPFSAMIYVPLAALPVEAAKATWYALTVFCVIGLFVVASRLVPVDTGARWYVLALPAAVLAKFCLRELKLGQINTLVTLLLLVMVFYLLPKRSSRRDAQAGALWGLATALKPYGFIFFPYFVVQRNWRALGVGAGVLAAAFLLPAALYGFEKNIEVHRDWYVTLTASTPAQFGVADNISIVGAFTKWTGDPAFAQRASLAVVGVLALGMLYVVARGRSLPRPVVLECALLLTLVPLVSPMGWDYQLLTSVLAMTLLARHFAELPARPLIAANLAVIGLSIYDVMGRTAYRAFMNASVLSVCFGIVVGYLVYLRAADKC